MICRLDLPSSSLLSCARVLASMKDYVNPKKSEVSAGFTQRQALASLKDNMQVCHNIKS